MPAIEHHNTQSRKYKGSRQVHQNLTRFNPHRHDPQSALPPQVLRHATSLCCRRCQLILRWKIDYGKYPTLIQILKRARPCGECGEKAVTIPFHHVCQNCCAELAVCAKCRRTPEESERMAQDALRLGVARGEDGEPLEDEEGEEGDANDDDADFDEDEEFEEAEEDDEQENDEVPTKTTAKSVPVVSFKQQQQQSRASQNQRKGQSSAKNPSRKNQQQQQPTASKNQKPQLDVDSDDFEGDSDGLDNDEHDGDEELPELARLRGLDVSILREKLLEARRASAVEQIRSQGKLRERERRTAMRKMKHGDDQGAVDAVLAAAVVAPDNNGNVVVDKNSESNTQSKTSRQGDEPAKNTTTLAAKGRTNQPLPKPSETSSDEETI